MLLTLKIEGNMSLLEVKNLKVHFPSRHGIIKAVNNISFSLSSGEVLAIVGESGSGKSMTALSILRLLDGTDAQTSGQIIYDNKDLYTLKESALEKIRGNKIAMVFQEPMTSLNPVFSIGNQISESLIIHEGKKGAKEKAVNMLKLAGIADAEIVYDKYPHQLSGGMRQRAMIAMALSCTPTILIADEPTTALDTTIQAQILELIRKLQRQFNTALILITHDLGIVAETADNIIILYCGEIVEKISTQDLFYKDTLKHPYTQALLDSSEEMIPIQGNIPSPLEISEGCLFAPRCSFAKENCFLEKPELKACAPNHYRACFYPCGGAPCPKS